MESTSQRPEIESTDERTQPTLNEIYSVEASFKQTFESIKNLFSSEKGRAVAIKDLVVAETKLSLSAIIICIGLAFTLGAVLFTLWAILNIGIGSIVFMLFASYAAAVIVPLALNAIIAWSLYAYIKRIGSHIGFSNTVNAVKKGE